MLRSPQSPIRIPFNVGLSLTRALFLYGLNDGPKVIIDNSEFRNFVDNPFIWWVRLRDTLPGHWITAIGEAVPNSSSDVETVIEYTSSAFAVADDGRGGSAFTRGADDGLFVEGDGNGAR